MHVWTHNEWRSPVAVRCGVSLRCVGPQQDLKTRFGQGYTLTLNYPLEVEQRVIHFVRELLPTAALVEKYTPTHTPALLKSSLS
jgi:hypothetical protein